MARLGPLGPEPRIAVAVSGGADSTALALLMQQWVATHFGNMVALIVDHGLRPESASEAALTQSRLLARNISTRIIRLVGLPTAAGVQQAARAARYQALMDAARQENCLFLALGHHAADQSETVTMRAQRGSGGLEGMAGWTARNNVLLLRPLLHMSPAVLRAYLVGQGMHWVEDPSNYNPRFERIRIRQAGIHATPASPAARQIVEREVAAFIAHHVTWHAQGFAVIHTNQAPAGALAALIRVVAGAEYAPAQAAVHRLSAALRPATLGGARLARTGKLGGGWVLAREPAACAPPADAVAGTVWDGRFRLQQSAKGQFIGALGADASAFRKAVALPALVLRGMPCLRLDGVVTCFPAPCQFTPPYPATSHPFAS